MRETAGVSTGMKLRWLLPALLAGVLLVGCQPDPIPPAAGSDVPHPTEHASPDETQDARDPYDY